MVPPLLVRASLRHLGRHPVQFGLSTLGIALGVALAVGIDLSSVNVRRAFTLSAEGVSGRATHSLVGGPRGIPESLYRRLRLEWRPGLPAVDLAPFVGGAVAVADRPGEVVQLVGLDPFASVALAPPGRAATPGGPTLLVTEPGAALISATTAKRLGLMLGQELALRLPGKRGAVHIVGITADDDAVARQALDGVVLVDLATAQELLDQTGWLSRIDLRTDDEGVDRLAAWLAHEAPDVRVEPVAARQGALASMTRAFDLNLRALSLLALLVGAFLIYNTMTFAVLRRRPLLATLRTLGATRGELGRLVVGEAAFVGLLGTTLGLGLGVFLAQSLVHLVSRAVTDLYFVVTVRHVAVASGPLWRGTCLGLGAAIVSALPAAREATHTAPRLALTRSVLEDGTRRALPRLAALGLLLGSLAVLLLVASRRALAPAFVALLLVVLGTALLCPGLTLLLSRGLVRWAPARRGGLPLLRMAAGNLGASLSRTGVAVAALMVALSVSVGVGLMVSSFRLAVEDWLQNTLRADVYVSAPTLVAAHNDGRLPRDLVRRLRQLPGVTGTSSYRGITLNTPQGPLSVAALDLDPRSHLATRFLAGDARATWEAFDRGAVVLASEPLSWRRGLHVGDVIDLPTPRGLRRFPVGAIFRDYGSDAGLLMINRRRYDDLFDDPYVSSVALFADPNTDPEWLVTRVRQSAAADEDLVVRSNRTLRTSSLAVFDRTFEITQVLRWLALIVAAFGLTGALMALQLERTRELGVLRALGFTPFDVGRLVAWETGLLGLLAGVFAVPVGALLAGILVHVINQRSFGWTMDLRLSASALLLAPALGLAAGVAGGLYPALVMGRTSPAEALRDE